MINKEGILKIGVPKSRCSWNFRKFQRETPIPKSYLVTLVSKRLWCKVWNFYKNLFAEQLWATVFQITCSLYLLSLEIWFLFTMKALKEINMYHQYVIISYIFQYLILFSRQINYPIFDLLQQLGISDLSFSIINTFLKIKTYFSF